MTKFNYLIASFIDMLKKSKIEKFFENFEFTSTTKKRLII